jgi:beta-lactamase regulating signal transducer with metallopeptidase domain
MMDLTSIWLRDVLSYSLQLAVLVAAGAALARAFGLREPRVTHAYWRTLLVIGLVLPFVQPWTPSPPPMVAVAVESTMTIAADPAAAIVVEPTARFPVLPIVAALLAGGIALRTLWLLVGAWTLRRLRRESSPLVPAPEPFRIAEGRLGVCAGLLTSTRIAGPITFGLTRPVVIVPPSVMTMSPHVQEAIAYHELLHVRRRDWVFEIVEEAIRAIFWFHPAIWWLIGRIQLSREQLVDSAAIQLTESKERYLDALLVVASTKSPTALVPAPLFLRRSLLKRRVAQILQETTMTTRRLITALSASAAAVALVAIAAVRSFPLQAQEPPTAMQQGSAPVYIVKGGDHLLHASMPEYPKRAVEAKVQGDVLLDLVTDERGEVADARVISGPDELRRAALESALQWHYDLRSTSIQATLRFDLQALASAEHNEFEKRAYAFTRGDEHREKEEFEENVQLLEHRMVEIERAMADSNLSDQQKDALKQKYAAEQKLLVKLRSEGGREVELKKAPLAQPSRVTQIRSERVTNDTMRELMSRANVKLGDQLDEVGAKRIAEIAANLDEHLRVRFNDDGKGGIVIVVVNP